jgi:hypothetical protein
MLARWRLFLAWMLLAALPVQGFAAGTMLLCAAATHEVTASAATDGGGHDHATHAHPSADAQSKGSAADPDPGAQAKHQCNLCASCCHSVAITQPGFVAQSDAAPAADLPDPVVPVATHLSRLLERPPRG